MDIHLKILDYRKLPYECSNEKLTYIKTSSFHEDLEALVIQHFGKDSSVIWSIPPSKISK